jgi:hypothetical protein
MKAVFKHPALFESAVPGGGPSRMVCCNIDTEVEIEEYGVDEHADAFTLPDNRRIINVDGRLYTDNAVFFREEPVLGNILIPRSSGDLELLMRTNPSRLFEIMNSAFLTAFNPYGFVVLEAYEDFIDNTDLVLYPAPKGGLKHGNRTVSDVTQFATSTVTRSRAPDGSDFGERVEHFKEKARQYASNFISVGGRMMTRCFEPALLVDNAGVISLSDTAMHRLRCDQSEPWGKDSFRSMLRPGRNHYSPDQHLFTMDQGAEAVDYAQSRGGSPDLDAVMGVGRHAEQGTLTSASAMADLELCRFAKFNLFAATSTLRAANGNEGRTQALVHPDAMERSYRAEVMSALSRLHAASETMIQAVSSFEAGVGDRGAVLSAFRDLAELTCLHWDDIIKKNSMAAASAAMLGGANHTFLSKVDDKPISIHSFGF